MQTLEEIEMTVRGQIQTHVGPELGHFLSCQVSGTESGRQRHLKSTLGSLTITTRQAERLAVPSHRQLSPHLENCCLRISANVSYEKATQDVDYLTGIRVPTQNSTAIGAPTNVSSNPEAEVPLSELSVDGGKVRIRTPLGENLPVERL